MNTTTSIQDKAGFHQELVNARLKMQGDHSHYLETVLELNGIAWVNHSIATTVDMTWNALRDVNGPLILIIGGVDRGNDHHKLRELLQEKAEAVICLGSTPWKYAETFCDVVKLIARAENTEQAIDLAHSCSGKQTKTVLFAPSCPSYDAFDNYRNRGDHFRKTVISKFSNKA